MFTSTSSTNVSTGYMVSLLSVRSFMERMRRLRFDLRSAKIGTETIDVIKIDKFGHRFDLISQKKNVLCSLT